MLVRRLVFILLFVCAFLPRSSFGFDLNAGGYYKSLGLASHGIATAKPYYGMLNRVRLDFDADLLPGLSSRIMFDNEVSSGSWVPTAEFRSIIAERHEPAFNLSWEPIEERNRFYGASLYRVYLKYDHGPVLVTVGRQKIDWGVLHVLSPEDLTTPLTFFQVEREEKTGVDGASLELRLPENLRGHFIYAAGPSWDKSRVGARVTETVGRFQISGMGGRFLKDTVAGIDFVGDVHDAGLRGELLHFWGDGNDKFLQGGVGADYAFAENWYALVEYLYNGQAVGVFNPLGLTTLTTSNRIKTLYRHFVSGQLKYDVTPLVSLTMNSIFDLEGESDFANPELKYELLSWMIFNGGGQFPFGQKLSEFGRIPNLYYLSAQLYF